MSGPPKKSRTLESFFSKSSRTSSVGDNPEISKTCETTTCQEFESKSTGEEFDTQSQDAVVQDCPEEETHPDLCCMATQVNVAISDRYDIGRAIMKTKRGEQLTDNEREAYLSKRWVPQRRDEYPFSEKKKPKNQLMVGMSSTTKRFLGENHLKTFPWLAVSREPKCCGAWCVYCVLFKTWESGSGRGAQYGGGAGQSMGKLVNKPLVNFSDLTGKNGALTSHQETSFHKTCAIKYTEFLSRATPGSEKDVRSIMNIERQKEIERNRTALVPIIDTLLTCARQNIALRGHRDDGPVDSTGMEPKHNDGNFRALLRLRVRGGDTNLKDHLKSCKRNASLVSKTIQNELIACAGNIVKEDIVRDVKNAKFWTIMADETQDCAKREQLVIAIRYVDTKNVPKIIKEEPVAILDLIADIKSSDQSDETEHNEIKLCGKAIGETLLRHISELGLDLQYLVGQGYDGAASMSSERVGVCSFIKSAAPLADYFHCCMHALNLSCSRAAKIPAIRHCMDDIKDINNFFKHAKRNSYLQAVIARESIEELQRRQLVTLCETRFVERHESVLVVRQLLPYIVVCLEEMLAWDSLDTRKDARRLLKSLQDPQFLVALVLAEKVSAVLRPVSRSLQQIGSDLVKAMSTISATQSKLYTWRKGEENEFASMFEEAMLLGENIGVTREEMHAIPRAVSQSRFRSNAGEANQKAIDYYRINVFLPLLDEVAGDMKARFGPHQQKIATLTRILPCFVKESTWQDILPAALKYGVFLDPLSIVEGEYEIWKQQWLSRGTSTVANTAIGALGDCQGDVFPNLHTLLNILTVLPVTTAEPERLFSKLNSTLTAIRSTMSEERLESLLLLQVHRDRTPTSDKLIDSFAALKSRRIPLKL